MASVPPAIIRNFSAKVDGIPQRGFVEILHAILGPHLAARAAQSDKMGFTIDLGGPGSVIRPGENNFGFTFRSKYFATKLFKQYRHLRFHVCYCAIVPGKCWLTDNARTEQPKPVNACPEIANDLLHTSGVDEITTRNL